MLKKLNKKEKYILIKEYGFTNNELDNECEIIEVCDDRKVFKFNNDIFTIYSNGTINVVEDLSYI